MKTKLTILILLLPGLVFAEPINHYVERKTNPDSTVTQIILAYPKYYLANDTYQEINTTFVNSSDPGWNWEVEKGVYKLRVREDGTFELNHLGDIFTQKIIGLGFYNTDTKERIVRSNINLTSPTINGNEITWALPLNCSYKIIYTNDDFKDVLTISQQAKNYLKNNKPAGWNLSDSWMGLIYDMDLANSSMIESKDFETGGEVNFVSNGKVKHKIKRAFVRHELADENTTALQWEKKKIYRNGKYVEAIPVTALESENGTLIFNTDVMLQEGLSGYSGVIDNRLDDDGLNHGTETTSQWFTAANESFVIKFDITSIPAGAVISDSDIYIYENMRGGGHLLDMYILKRDWNENTSTFYNYSAGNTWQVVGALGANDVNATSFNRTYNENGGWVKIDTTTEAQDWLDGNYSNYGIKVWNATNAMYDQFDTSQFTTDTTKRPYINITYTGGEAPPATASGLIFFFNGGFNSGF